MEILKSFLPLREGNDDAKPVIKAGWIKEITSLGFLSTQTEDNEKANSVEIRISKSSKSLCIY